MYLQPALRKGLLGRMLTELLDTRVMVKQAMKSVSGDKVNTVRPLGDQRFLTSHSG
jgi:DNA polymerase elongation subunit (family B)